MERGGMNDDFSDYGETSKSLVTKQEANLFTVEEAGLAALIVEHLAVEPEKVTRQARFVEDLGADSLDMVELTMAIEDRFGIEISDDEAAGVVTVQDAFANLKTALEHKADATIRPIA